MIGAELSMLEGISAAQLLALADALPALVAYITSEEIVLYANRELEHWHGLSPGSMCGLSLRQILPDPFYAATKARVARALNGEKVLYQTTFLRDGQECFIEGQFQPDVAADGLVRGIIMVSHDVTARRRAEQAQESATVSLLASQAKLAAILEGVADGIVAQASSGRIVFANQAAARILNIPSADSLIGMEPDELFSRYEVANESGQLVSLKDLPSRRILRGESVPRETLLRIRHLKSKSERWLAMRATALWDPHGNSECVIGIFSDITERLRREQALRFLDQASRVLSSSLEYQTTLQQVARLAVEQLGGWCAVRLVDNNGRLAELAVEHIDPTHVKTAREIFEEYPPDPQTGRGEYEALRNGASVFIPIITEDLIRERAVDDRHYGLITSLGLQSYICTPILADGKSIGVISFASGERFYDEHDLALAEELAKRASLAVQNARLYKRAKEAVEMRDLFLSIASHELRTPITSMKLQTQQMARSIRRGDIQALTPESVRKMVDQSARSIDRLVRLIEDMLDISRLQMGRLGLQPEPVGIVEVLREVLDRFAPQLQSAGIEVNLTTEAEPRGLWDHDRLDQVVTNLVTNAIRYAPGGPLDITVRADGIRVFVEFTDSGPGIAPENHERIFQRFERLVNASEVSGLGLGLYIVREFLRAQGGAIAVRSRLGQGATFTVELPLESSVSS